MLLVYNQIVSARVRDKRVEELKDLFSVRIIENKMFFEKNQLIITSYDFVPKVIENLFGQKYLFNNIDFYVQN